MLHLINNILIPKHGLSTILLHFHISLSVHTSKRYEGVLNAFRIFS